jgi:hypothetical protein
MKEHWSQSDITLTCVEVNLPPSPGIVRVLHAIANQMSITAAREVAALLAGCSEPVGYVVRDMQNGELLRGPNAAGDISDDSPAIIYAEKQQAIRRSIDEVDVDDVMSLTHHKDYRGYTVEAVYSAANLADKPINPNQEAA